MADVPYGFCQCGCGERTKIATRSRTRDGMVKGEPMRFITGHNIRGARWHVKQVRYIEEDRGYKTPCWVWRLALTAKGYPRLNFGNQKVGRAHRYYYEQANGPIPDGLEIDHLCRVRACVNPEHLEAVTHTENLRRRGSNLPAADSVAEASSGANRP